MSISYLDCLTLESDEIEVRLSGHNLTNPAHRSSRISSLASITVPTSNRELTDQWQSSWEATSARETSTPSQIRRGLRGRCAADLCACGCISKELPGLREVPAASASARESAGQRIVGGSGSWVRRRSSRRSGPLCGRFWRGCATRRSPSKNTGGPEAAHRVGELRDGRIERQREMEKKDPLGRQHV